MLTLKSVSKIYSGQNRVLQSIDLQLRKGEFLYLVGGSGAGKSSLLRLLATEEQPTEGNVELFGYAVGNASASTLRTIRRAIGYVPQDSRLIPDLTVAENIAISLSVSGQRILSADARQRLAEILERLGLIAKRNHLAGSLSGGEAQRVAVARALIRKPDLIIADEPTGAQDRDNTWTLMDLFLKANLGGATVVVATHDREIVRRVRKRCATLKNGQMSFEEALCFY